jgi:transcriptional regulator with XRE-family HTH domain
MMPRTKSARPVDKHVGSQVRMRRLMLAMSQTTLGEAVGVSFQQVQKYENGMNRIGASRLMQIAQILQVPAAFFFDGASPLFGGQIRSQKARPRSPGIVSSSRTISSTDRATD